jgi:hypothetical protein
MTRLIDELAERGVTLTADGVDLIARPTSAITPEVAETIRSNKDELIALLTDQGMSEELAAKAAGSPAPTSPPKDTTFDVMEAYGLDVIANIRATQRHWHSCSPARPKPFGNERIE